MSSGVSAMEERSSGRGGHRNGGGRFRAEIEMDRGIAVPRSPEMGFAAAVREPLVRLQRPKYDFERWDWDYFAWPHDRLDANLEMRDSDPKATFEADQQVIEGFLSRSTLQLEASEGFLSRSPLQLGASEGLPSRSKLQLEKREMQEQQEIDDDPFRRGALWRHGCAESNPILEHGHAIQGPCAY